MIDFGNGRHSAFAASSAVALFDANRGRNTGDQIHVRSRELFHELPRIQTHRIEKSSLAFRKEQIERQRALARPADPGDDNELVTRDRE